MLSKVVTLAALVLITLLAAPLILAQQQDTGVEPSESSFTPTVDTPQGAGVVEYGDPSCASLDHVPGEFIVQYDSEETMWAAPQENVVETLSPSLFMQLLRFEDIASIPDSCQRLAAEEEMRQEILAWPGVQSVDYNHVRQFSI